MSRYDEHLRIAEFVPSTSRGLASYRAVFGSQTFEDPDMLVLDIGHGNSPLQREIEETGGGAKVFGVDPSYGLWTPEATRLDGESMQTAGVGQYLPFREESFDRVTSLHVFRYFPPRVARLVTREALRVLKPDGILMVGPVYSSNLRSKADGILDIRKLGRNPSSQSASITKNEQFLSLRERERDKIVDTFVGGVTSIAARVLQRHYSGKIMDNHKDNRMN